MGAVRIGFVGVGTMGQMAHLRNYGTCPDCEVRAIAELREATGREVARRYGVPKVYPSAAEMLEAEELDAVVASQPFTRHGIVLPQLLAYGKPVFVEKPLASSPEVGRRLVEAVEASNTFVMVGYHKRSDPATEYARAAIAELTTTGALGPMTYLRILMPAGDWIAHGFDELISAGDSPAALDLDPAPPSLSEERRAEYVAFVNYYIHQVNLLRFLLGEDYKPVFADRSGALLVGESRSGIPCTIEMSPYNTSVAWQEEVLICFRHGWIKLALPAPLALNRPGTVTLYADPPESPPRATGAPDTAPKSEARPDEAQVARDVRGLVSCGRPMELSPTLPWVHAMKRQAENFIAAVQGDRPPVTAAAEALDDLLVAERYLDLYDEIRGKTLKRRNGRRQNR